MLFIRLGYLRLIKNGLLYMASFLSQSYSFSFGRLINGNFLIGKKAFQPILKYQKNIDVSAEYGLFGGCGFAVFELSPNMLNLINTLGIDALSNARISQYYNYEEWQKTPIATVNSESTADFWQMGMSCGYPSIDTELQNKIQEALNNPNSFYTLASDAGIIVIPKLKLVVVSVWS